MREILSLKSYEVYIDLGTKLEESNLARLDDFKKHIGDEDFLDYFNQHAKPGDRLKPVIRQLYCGDDHDWLNLEKEFINGTIVDQPTNNWAVLHAAKEPNHRQFVGYTGRGAPKDHPEYLWAERGNRLALNIVDAPSSIFFDKGMIDKALDFIDKKLGEGLKVLVHCNEGHSRSCSICLLYIIKHGIIKGKSLEDCEAEFLKVYPEYMPGSGMRAFMKEHWSEYCG